MVGAFWQPLGGAGSTRPVLATLPEREYRAGLAEVVKYGVILDDELFGYLEATRADLDGPRRARCWSTSSCAAAG